MAPWAALAALLAACLPRAGASADVAWFVSWQHAGHVRALCPTARELRRRGWEVAVAVHEEARRYVPPDLDVVSAGPLPWSWDEELEFRDLLWSASPPPPAAASSGGEGADADAAAAARAARRAEASERYFLGSQRSLAQGLLAAIDAAPRGRAPALLVVDVASVGAMDVAELRGINFAVFSSWPVGPTLHAIADDSRFENAWLPSEFFVFTQSAGQQGLYDRLLRAVVTAVMPLVLEFAGFHTPRRQLRTELGLPPGQLELMEMPKLQGNLLPLVLISNHWGMDRARPLPPHIVLLGPTDDYSAAVTSHAPLSKATQEWLATGSVVYVSLGTNVRPNGAQISALLEGMRSLPDVRFLWDSREEMSEHLVNVPGNVRLEEWVDQLAVLGSGKVSAFVSHCGLNSLHEAMHFGIPVIGLPFIADQLVSARLVEEVGASVRLVTHRFSAPELAAAVRQVVENAAYADAARRIGQLGRKAGGAKVAADMLILAHEHGTGHLQMRREGAAGRLWDVYLTLSLPFIGVFAAARCWLVVRRQGDMERAKVE